MQNAEPLRLLCIGKGISTFLLAVSDPQFNYLTRPNTSPQLTLILVGLLLKMIFALLGFFLRRPGFSVLAISQSVLLFIAFILLLVLNFACFRSTGSLSGIFIAKVASNSSRELRTGYFRICEKTAVNSTLVCRPLGSFKGHNLAYDFAKRVTRPYFVILATIFTLIALICCIIAAVNRYKLGPQIQVGFGTAGAAFGFTVIGACWQQVATQSAVVLLPNQVTRGHRAAGMIWSALAMQLLTLMQYTFLAWNNRQNGGDAESMNSSVGSSNSEPKISLPKQYGYSH